MTTNNPTTSPAEQTSRKRIQIHFDSVGRTRQEHQDECDINQIMAKFQKTGALDHVANTENNYSYADSTTFTEAINLVTTGEQMFANLPSSLRHRFHYSPAEFLEFVQDPSNTADMHQLGLLSPEASAAHLLSLKTPPAAPEPPLVVNDEPISPINPGPD